MPSSNTDITIAAYNKNARGYRDKFMTYQPYREKMIGFQKRHLSTGDTILDLGCGPGNNVKLLSDLDSSYQITGIDLSEAMIKIARESNPEQTFITQDIRELSPDQQYRAVIASFCIVHLSDSETETLLRAVADMLNEGGSLYLSFMAGKEPGIESTSFSEAGIFFNYFERDTMTTLLGNLGFDPIEVMVEPYEERDGSITDDIFLYARKKA